MRSIVFAVLASFCLQSFGQEMVSFKAEDGLSVTADLYLLDKNKPFILLFHQAESSRGEYVDIAPKLMRLGYNCLAVDLRSGLKSNYIKNETASKAAEKQLSTGFIDAQKDIVAAIEYVKRYNHLPVILFGSSYSASLSLMIGAQNKRISSVIAFSPGEYFRPEVIVKENISELKAPVFIAASEFEYDNVKEITSTVTSNTKVFYKPSKGRGAHGAKALWESTDSSSECWLNLTHFFSRL